jgi:hypothetical protein
MASALLLIAVVGVPALAQIDSDPDNDSISGGDVLSLSSGAAINNLATFAGEGGDIDFFNVALASNDVLLGITAPLFNLPVDMDFPDTMASVLFNGAPITFSDDSFAEVFVDEDTDITYGRGSIFRVRASMAGTYNIAVTGYPDYELDGNATGDPHEEVGPYALAVARVNPAVLGGNFNDTDSSNSTTAGADQITIGTSQAAVSVSNLLAGDIDYYKLTLAAGDVLSVMTAPLADTGSFDVPDTLLGLYDSSGTLLVQNDDAGDQGYNELYPDLGSDTPIDLLFGSAIHALIPADGTYYLRVEESLEADGTQVGRYAMLVGVQPTELMPDEPADFNQDGTIDAADYVVWRKFFGSLYDTPDYEHWVETFGEPNPGAGSAPRGTVPEPQHVLLLVSIAAVVGMSRFRIVV